MNYQGNIIRPPSEAGSIILQVTVGCSHNKCTFCGAYKDVNFQIKDNETIENDLEYARTHYPQLNKIFLADGDVLILSQKRLLKLFNRIRQKLPAVKRIRLYGNCKSIRSKSTDELQELKSLGLDRIYMGLESGLDSVLLKINKGSSSKQMIEAAQKVNAAKIFLSITVLLGIAGNELSHDHAIATGKTLNLMKPNQIAALTLMPIPGTTVFDQIKANEFTLPDHFGLLKELRLMIDSVQLDRVQFQSNHASNYLPIDCRLKRDKENVLKQIDQALSGNIPLMPEFMRGL